MMGDAVLDSEVANYEIRVLGCPSDRAAQPNAAIEALIIASMSESQRAALNIGRGTACMTYG